VNVQIVLLIMTQPNQVPSNIMCSHATLWYFSVLLLCVLIMAAVLVGTLSKLCLYFGELLRLDVLNIISLPVNSYNCVRCAVLNSCITCLDAFLSTLFLLVLRVY
jgi:hypothetical protein